MMTKSPLVTLASFDERAVGSHEHHPNRRGLGKRKRFRMLHDGVVRGEITSPYVQ